jgi:hypothetical protein
VKLFSELFLQTEKDPKGKEISRNATQVIRSVRVVVIRKLQT